MWRFVGGKAEILLRAEDGTGYEAKNGSKMLPILTADALARLVEEGLEVRRPDWVRRLREWAQQALDR